MLKLCHFNVDHTAVNRELLASNNRKVWPTLQSIKPNFQYLQMWRKTRAPSLRFRVYGTTMLRSEFHYFNRAKASLMRRIASSMFSSLVA